MFDEAYVHALAARRGEPVVTSFYLDVDGRRYARPADYEPHVTHLLHAARTTAAHLGGAAEAAVDADLDRIRRWVDHGLDRTTVRGIAVFSCAAQDFFEPVVLPVTVRDQVSIQPGPNVVQLLTILEHRRRTLVVLVDRHQARIVRVELGVSVERPRVLDEPERQADNGVELGGWERRHDEAARRHFRRVATRMSAEIRDWHPHGLVLSGSADDVAGLEACLGSDVADLVVAVVKLSMRSSSAEIVGTVLTIGRDLEQRREEALVDELQERAAQGRKAVLGLTATMAALADGRVGTLVVARGFHAPGARCPACGHVGVPTCQCPECGTPSVELDDIVEVAINRALAQGAAVELCEGTELQSFGSVGALERF